VWLLSNNKQPNRKGKVQLIDAGQLYRKLRKNLGNKNCEFAPEHIREIVNTYEALQTVERTGDEGIASKVFNNADFGYYKVTIERPKRLKAQFTVERIEELRFEKTLREPMEWAYAEFGEEVYTNLSRHEKAILDWCDKNELNLNAKQSKTLTTPATWQKGVDLITTAIILPLWWIRH
jgi:type I restriction enzyme M protein